MSGKYIYIFLIFLSLTGCHSSLGPDALRSGHPSYNQSIVDSLNQQMLLNLVRLKYRDEPHFLTVSSVTSSLSFGGSFGANASIDLGPARNLIQPNVGVSYSESPTISYQPLQGEDFLKSVLSPIPLEAVLVLTESGWNIDRVLGLSVERMNNLYNAPTASGPTPSIEPDYKRFSQAISLFRSLQVSRDIDIGLDKTGRLKVFFKKNDQNKQKIEQLFDLLGFKNADSSSLIDVGTNFIYFSDNEITLRTRSIYSVLFYLSQTVAVPEEHVENGLVTVTKNRQGGKFDWTKTPVGKKFRVNVSTKYPKAAFLAVPYRDHWYYINDNDLHSKSTFMLLRQLFDLQAGQSENAGPALTLPVR